MNEHQVGFETAVLPQYVLARDDNTKSLLEESPEELEYPVSKRRRTIHMSQARRVDVRTSNIMLRIMLMACNRLISSVLSR